MHRLPGGLRIGPGGALEAPGDDRLRASIGTSGAVVGEIQGLLNFFGASPPLALDNQFGPLTQAAVRAFQLANGLTVDGAVGPETSAALQNSDSRSIGGGGGVTKAVTGMSTGAKVALGLLVAGAGYVGVKKLQEHRKKKRAA